MNLFENDAIMNSCFKEFVATNMASGTFKKPIISERKIIKSENVSGEVLIGKFFPILGGTLRIYAEISATGSGTSASDSIVLNVKNLENGEVQQVYGFIGMVGNYTSVINISKHSRYEITMSVLSGTTYPTIRLNNLELVGDIVEKNERYLISEEVGGDV